MKAFVKLIIILGLMIILTFGLNANGLNLNGIGSKAIAMGGAFIGLSDDYSAVFWNPAGYTQMTESSITLFETNIIPSGIYNFEIGTIPIVDNAGTVSKVYPSGLLGYFNPVSEKLVLGISVYVPAGSGSKWNGDDLQNLITPPTSYRWDSQIAVITVSPVIAFKISENFSVGVTLNINYGMLKMHKPGVGQYSEDLDGIAFGATFGILYKPLDKLGFGLSLKTPIKVKLSGDAMMEDASLVGMTTSSETVRDATWPMWIGIGISFKPIEKLTFTLDAQYTKWTEVDTIAVTYSDANWQAAKSIPGLDEAFDNDFELNWDDKVQYRVGVEYIISNSFAVRAGYYSDPSPSPLDTLNILLPQTTYNVVTFGVGYKSKKISFDLGIEYLMGKDLSSPLTGIMPGDYSLSILVPNIAFTIKF